MLGVANIAMRAQWHQVEDGVLWQAHPEGVTAAEVAGGSPAGSAPASQRGDVLDRGQRCARRTAVRTSSRLEHRSAAGTRLSYTLVRLGSQQALDVTLAPSPHGSPMYFVLAAVGLFTLLVGASVRLRRPGDQATLHFFWLCVAFFGVFTFSFNGPFDRLDWIFYWGDAVAMVAAAAAAARLHGRVPGTAAAIPVRLVAVRAARLRAGRWRSARRASIVVTRGAADGQAFSRAIDFARARRPHLSLPVRAWPRSPC